MTLVCDVSSLEESLDRLAARAQAEVAPAEFLSLALTHALLTSGTLKAHLWVKDQTGLWSIQQTAPNQQSAPAQSVQDEVPRKEQLRTLNEVASHGQPVRRPGSALLPISIINPASLMIEVQVTGEVTGDQLAFFAAVAEITSNYLMRYELRQSRSVEAMRFRLDRYRQQLSTSKDLLTACSVAAHDGRVIVDGDRVSILTREGTHFALRAVSGVDHLEPRAASSRSLESVAELVSDRGGELWFDREHPGDLSQEPILVTHCQHSNARTLYALPMIGAAGGVFAVAVFEQFDSRMEPIRWRDQCQKLVQSTSDVIRAHWSEDELSRSHWWKIRGSLPTAMQNPKGLIAVACLTVLAATLLFVPAELTVGGPARLWPARRRVLFASSHGIVDQLLVKHGDPVTRDQPLVVLSDPELEAEFPRLTGEIATVGERLRGIQASRLAGSNGPDAAANSRRTAADEEEWKARLSALESQKLLLEKRRTGLTHLSPITGQVMTWDLESLLTGRPVERGQALLTVGEVDGPWQIEVDVSDQEIGEIIRAKKTVSELQVEFILAADPGTTYRGRVTQIAMNTEIDSQGRSSVRVIAQVDSRDIRHLRPGAAVIPRIPCGKRSLGAVWFRDLIVMVRSKLLF